MLTKKLSLVFWCVGLFMVMLVPSSLAQTAQPKSGLKERLKNGEICTGTFLAFLSGGDATQFLAGQGLDFLILDTEHGAFDFADIRQTIIAARGAGISPLIRIPEPDHNVSRTLDAGAEGIIIPLTENRQQAESLVKFGRYRPIGQRGISTLAGHNNFSKIPNVPKFLEDKNKEVLLFVMIETPLGVKNREEILSTPGIDGVIVGTGDLAMNLGHAGQSDHPEVIVEAEKVIATAKAHNLIVSIPIRKPTAVDKWIKSGMNMITFGSDMGLFSAGVDVYMSALKAAQGKQ